jgi:hypothetical protein
MEFQCGRSFASLFWEMHRASVGVAWASSFRVQQCFEIPGGLKTEAVIGTQCHADGQTLTLAAPFQVSSGDAMLRGRPEELCLGL